MTDVDVANNISVHRDVLANHEPAKSKRHTHTPTQTNEPINKHKLRAVLFIIRTRTILNERRSATNDGASQT